MPKFKFKVQLHGTVSAISHSEEGNGGTSQRSGSWS
jgi:hypothetical protein